MVPGSPPTKILRTLARPWFSRRGWSRPADGSKPCCPRSRRRIRAWSCSDAPSDDGGIQDRTLASPLVDQVGNQPRPPGLVVRAESRAVLTMEVFVEEEAVAPVGI